MISIVIDAQSLKLYPVAREGFSGGTEGYVRALARGLADRGYETHVVAPDCEREERRGEVYWWPPGWHPRSPDVLVAMHNLEYQHEYDAPTLVLGLNGVDPWMGDDNELMPTVDAFPCFSQCHIELLHQARGVPKERCHVTGLGVDTRDYATSKGEGTVNGKSYRWAKLHTSCKVPGRMLYANDPARGLWHVLDIFDHVRREVPDASLHVAYDFERQFSYHRWNANAVTEMLWECNRRIEATEGVRNVGALGREDLIREQLECHIHAMPSDPPNVGSQIHGLAQMELAAAGTPLVLSDIEAFPEVFGDGALILPLPGQYLPQLERRYDAQDWAEAVIQLMRDEDKWREASRKARALAERHTWDAVLDRWDAMLRSLVGEEVAA